MGLRRLVILHYILGAAVLVSCSTASAPVYVPAEAQAAPALTPFQPGTRNAIEEPAAWLPLSTFTPYPGTALPVQTPADLPVVVNDATSDQPPAEINPLTGLPPSDPALLDRRPLVIKISNYPRDIRPQYGLNEADVVYEYYIEWQDTRFIGVFYGNDASQIGPVRSGRYFDEHITRMYHAYYVFNYADPREYTYYLGGDLQPFMVVPGYGACPPFAEHKYSSLISDSRHYEMYFNSTKFSDCLARKSADNSRQPLRNGFFSALPPADGAPVDRIYTHYSKCDYNYWQYDPTDAVYMRFQETSPSKDLQHLNDCSDTPETYAPLKDALTKQQVTADNVVVIYVPHTFTNQNEQDDEIYHINLVDTGKAFVFRDGLALPARWQRTDIDEPLLITSPSGTPILLKPGRTFYQVIGSTSSDWSDGSNWHFEFDTP